MLVIDLDRLGVVNATWGRAAGDAVLSATAAVITDELRPGDRLDRDGDEFVVRLTLPVRGRSVAALAETVRRRVAALCVPVETAHGLVTISGATASIGAAVAGPTGARPAVLLWSADSALHAAKRAGRDTVRVVPASAAHGPAG